MKLKKIVASLVFFVLFTTVPVIAAADNDNNLIQRPPDDASYGKDWRSFGLAYDGNHETGATITVKKDTAAASTMIWIVPSTTISSVVFNGKYNTGQGGALQIRVMVGGQWRTAVNIDKNETGAMNIPQGTAERVNLPEPIQNVTRVAVAFSKQGSDTITLNEVGVYAKPLQDDTPPTAPQGVKASAGDQSVALYWSPNPEPDLSKYRVYMNGSPVKDVTGTSALIDKLENGKEYTFTVSALDQLGNESEQSNAVKAVPSQAPPAAVQGLEAQVNDDFTAIELTWQPVADAKSYVLEYADAGSFKALGKTEATQYKLDKINGKTKYAFRVAAMNASGAQSAWSNVAEITTPSRDTETETKPVDDYLLLTWQPVQGATGYDIYYNNKLIDSVAAATLEYKITKEKGYNPSLPFQSAKAIAKFADGSSGGSSGGNGSSDLGDLDFMNPINMIKTAVSFLLLYKEFILIVLGIIFAPTLYGMAERLVTSARQKQVVKR